ncbi:type IV secretion system DNA-binding domain-containing protein [Novosphingobium sp. P6W]|uniref:type IV secretion system DNA-binding domain-containing protein n=1 Tax=Novosphingobium sp. P6W TaxID=1609758 RepID=UPI0005C2CF73|nr:type IV secretion system DNA-binding domain-containing protein [Novosphingobium sp. P6W]AXB80235.1 DUF87 domain-containing protein [Novosphingobium sp. P6W]KIS31578.1 conjugal transfer protein TraD [Novosphingobium sp. P6W]
MRDGDLRFGNRPVTLEHHSARGKVIRNTGNFTRGSQLFAQGWAMTGGGIRIPFVVWLSTSAILMVAIFSFNFREHEIQLLLMKGLAEAWAWVDLDPDKVVHLTLPDGSVVVGRMSWVPDHPAVAAAWIMLLKLLVATGLGSVFLCAPLTIWFVDYSVRRGRDILKERHERGALLVARDILVRAIGQYNFGEFAKECAVRTPRVAPAAVLKVPMLDRTGNGHHVPYALAAVPYPWRMEQSHAMLVGTTGSGKTTALKSIVAQARQRGHRCVIFDLTGSFVESFYNPKTDIILNTMDERCQPWTIFSDCDNYAEFLSAATALIPSGHNAEDDFWQKAARTLFVEMCMKLIERGETSNGALAHHLMQADLKRISRELESTVAAPLVATEAAKMAESIRATFNTHANALRFLPDPPAGLKGFSINEWMAAGEQEGSILFVTSSHPDLVLNRPLLTLWMDIAVNALFRLGRTRALRTWFLLDEVHALHRLPAIENGLQTARGVGGAFVLGIHSFGKLAETYGENGAIALASLARTKLILTTSDIETAKRCSDFIGSREVRQMDEAYSYGYARSRDASTITPRKEVQHLVMPDDIKELPSLHGYIKFPDGFPAAKVRLAWRDYPQVAHGFHRVTTMRAARYVPVSGGDNVVSQDGGRVTDGPVCEPKPLRDLGDLRDSASGSQVANATAMPPPETNFMLPLEAPVHPPASGRSVDQPSKNQGTGDKGVGSAAKPGEFASYRNSRRESKSSLAARSGDEVSAAGCPAGQDRDNRGGPALSDTGRDDQESLISKEERFGLGDEADRPGRSATDDFEPGR